MIMIATEIGDRDRPAGWPLRPRSSSLLSIWLPTMHC